LLSSAEIEREFRYEIQEKKRTASGVHHKTGKRGYTGTIYFPHNLLRGKEKREYTKPGKVRRFNMYTTMMELSELQRYDQDRQREIIEKWRELHKAKEIQEALGIDHNTYYDLLYDLEVLERPASAKPKKHTGVKRDKPNAQEKDIMKFQDLKLLPKEKQLEKLDEYNEKYNLNSVAEIWGRDVKNVYSLRYQLRKKLGKPNIYETSVEENVEKPKQRVLNIETVPKKEKINPAFLAPEPQEEPQIEEVKEEKVHEYRDENHFEIDGLKNELNSLRQQMFEILKQQQEQVQEVVTPEPKKAAMQFSFEDQKEGFMLHQDLMRFISVLQKNPDQFKVEVKITRVEE
jgi:hypothetical protein